MLKLRRKTDIFCNKMKREIESIANSHPRNRFSFREIRFANIKIAWIIVWFNIPSYQSILKRSVLILKAKIFFIPVVGWVVHNTLVFCRNWIANHIVNCNMSSYFYIYNIFLIQSSTKVYWISNQNKNVLYEWNNISKYRWENEINNLQ